MGKPYFRDLRESVMAAADSGIRAYAAAPIFRVGVSYITKALGWRQTRGETSAHPWAGDVPRCAVAPRNGDPVAG
ncbi:MAG: hypothetical protein M3Z96_13500 [Pseudomonadota bacterium]|nr:hypothetical protein [Pseudomonadota bacterium]